MNFNELPKFWKVPATELPKFTIKTKKRIRISFAILFILFSLVFFALNQFPLTGKIIDTEGYKIIPLNPEQREQVKQSILVSEFIKDLPKKDPVFLRFFSFENGKKVWQDGFLIGKNEILIEGEPSIYFSIHSKYISELDGQDLCAISGKANENGDVGIFSDYSKPRLFLKYNNMLKYKKCFGF